MTIDCGVLLLTYLAANEVPPNKMVMNFRLLSSGSWVSGLSDRKDKDMREFPVRL